MAKIEKAQRKQAKLRLAIAGPSGSGKTLSALLIAFGIGPKVLVGDTEERSASLYADAEEGEPLHGKSFDTVIIDKPYTIAKYLDVITAAEQGGYDVLILDSISHAWAGEGGLLQKKEALDSRGGTQNQWTNWGSVTKEHEAFRARILDCKVHLICTLRSKQEYIQVEKNGKKVIEKLGMAPIQREGIEYEFTAVLDMAMDHTAKASKHRTGKLLDDQIFKPTVKTGEALLGWLSKGTPTAGPEPAKPAAVVDTTPMTPEQTTEIMDLVLKFQAITKETDERISQAIKDRVKKAHKVEIAGITSLTKEHAETIIASLKHWIEVSKKKAEAEAEKGAGHE